MTIFIYILLGAVGALIGGVSLHADGGDWPLGCFTGAIIALALGYIIDTEYFPKGE